MTTVTDTNFTYAVLSATDKTLSVIGVNTTRYPTTLANWGTFPQIPIVYGGTNPTYNGNGTPANAYKITEIGVSAFESKTAFSSTPLSPTFLPANLTRIGNKAFAGVALQGTLTIPENIVAIGEMAFYNCLLITNVVIGRVVNSDVISHLSDLTAVLNQEILARTIADDSLHLLKAPKHNAVLTGTAAFSTANVTTAAISTANATAATITDATIQSMTVANRLDVSGGMTFSGSTTTTGQWNFTAQPKYNADVLATEAHVTSNVIALAGDMTGVMTTLLELTTAIEADPNFATTVIDGNSVLSASLIAETGARNSATTSLSIGLSLATASLATADSTLSTALSAEASTRGSAVASLSHAASTSAALFGSADTALSTGISTEVRARSISTSVLSSTLRSATASLATADSALSTALSAETSSRASAVASLSLATSTAAASLGAADTALSTGISSEISARIHSVSVLSSALNSATASLALVDSSLSTALSAEASGLGSARVSLSASVSGVTSQAQTNIRTLSAAVSAETAALGNDTTLLSASVMTAANPITLANSALNAGILAETTAREGAISGVSVHAAGVVAGLDGSNVALSAAISAEILVRTSQVESISAGLGVAVPSLAAAASALSTALAAEIYAATSTLNAELSAIKGSAPGSLDTLQEIAHELNTNPSLAQVASVAAVVATASNTLSAEVVNRTSAMTSVTSALSSAVVSLSVADASISSGLSAEASTRGASVASVSVSLANATTNFTAATGARSASLAAETSVRAASIATVNNSIYAFTTFTFNSAGTSGRFGPNIAAVRTAYANAGATWASSHVNMTTQGIQEWTVPATGIYTIRAAGAQGASTDNVGGAGIIVELATTLVRGEKIKILVGQPGLWNGWGGGGGGGTFVVRGDQTPIPIVVAGGGGGTDYNNSGAGRLGVDGSMNTSGENGGGGGAGGANGNGGNSGSGDGGGAGLLTNGGNAMGGASFINGGVGGTGSGEGGFGGGGGVSGYGGGGAGGGGYSGGGGGGAYGGGGGGGSYGVSALSNIGLNRHTGFVTITASLGGTAPDIIADIQLSGLRSALSAELTNRAVSLVSFSTSLSTASAGLDDANPASPLPANTINMVNYRNTSNIYSIMITGDNNNAGVVWGTNIYTDDSNIVKAAMHAGFISHGETKTVYIEMLPGQQSYSASTQNSITSNSYGSFLGSYKFIFGANRGLSAGISTETANRTAAIASVASVLSVSVAAMQTAINAASGTIAAVSSAAALKTTTAYLSAQISTITGGAQATLDTLAELGAALNNQNNLAGSITAVLANKAAATDVSALSTALTQRANQSEYASLSAIVSTKAAVTAAETASIGLTALGNTIDTLVAEVSTLKTSGGNVNPDTVVANGVSLTDITNWTQNLYVRRGLTHANGTINEKLVPLKNPVLVSSVLMYEYAAGGAVIKVNHVVAVRFDKNQKSVSVTGGPGNPTVIVNNLVLDASNHYAFTISYPGDIAYYTANKTAVTIVALDTPYKLAPALPTVTVAAPT
jgi:hypothetical protein